MKNILYDIENHNDFYDSLHIMETIANESFKLIFMELPPLIKTSAFIYNTQITTSINIRNHFLRKCIENAHRLLTPDGVFVLYTHKDTYSTFDYFLLLNQFFPKIKDITLYHDYREQPCPLNIIYFCNKQDTFAFPEHSLLPTESYPYRDYKGLYRYENAFNLKSPKRGYDYTWKNILPPCGWRYPQNMMDEYANKNRIFADTYFVYIKKYRFEESIFLKPNEQLLWKVPEYSFKNKGVLRTCDIQSLDRIFSLYCSPGDSVFCPFDYSYLFPYMADKQDLSWTSIHSHIFARSSKMFYDISNIDYDIISTLPYKNSIIDYRSDIIMTPQEMDNFKEQIKTLTTSIRTVKTILQIEDEDTNMPFGNLHIGEDILANRFHAYINSSIPIKLLDNVSQYAKQEYNDYWEKLEKNSQKYIKTALVFQQSVSISDIDYSAILIELFKVLENEFYVKIFYSYAQKLKKEKIKMTQKYPKMNRSSKTKDFWEYLHCYIHKNQQLPLTLSCMSIILKKTLTNEGNITLYTDFMNYLLFPIVYCSTT